MSADAIKPPVFFQLLAHELRWELLMLLAGSDYRVQELVRRLGQPANLISYHLKHLRIHGIIHERRSSVDGRDLFYSLDLPRLAEHFETSGGALHPALLRPGIRPDSEEEQLQAAASPVRVLFLCTHNSARSQMAEGILRSLGGEVVEVMSAGTVPSEVHPEAIQTLAGMGFDISAQRGKSVEHFIGQRFDFIITVCDRAQEECPTFPGEAMCIHWSLADPAAVSDPALRTTAFAEIANELITRIRYLLMRIEQTTRRNYI